MYLKTHHLVLCTAFLSFWASQALAEETTVSGDIQNKKSTTEDLEELTVFSKRETRMSSGATKLPLAIKDTPQTISIIDDSVMKDFGMTGSNEALRLGTGINVDQYETNRATFNSRGFEIQLTQLDGLGTTNDYATVVGQLDTYLFDKIELIRGANGLLTGVGNSSGTINYVRKRPTNIDGGEIQLSGGSHSFKRIAADYNKVLTKDGKWAGRVVVAHEDKDSHLRAVHDKNTSLYGVVDGQIGENGVLTMGLSIRDSKQDSPMWGSLTLFYPDGSLADFDHSSSTSQDWTYWNTSQKTAFLEYTHLLGQDWEAKLTYNVSKEDSDSRLFYAYTFTNALNEDNTGLYGWPYSGHTETDRQILDINISGDFDALGNEHSLIAGISASKQELVGEQYDYDREAYQNLPLPAFPYAGNIYPEPEWFPREQDRSGEQKLTRFYVSSKLGLSENLNAVVGVNAIKLEREGSSRYGGITTQTDYPDTTETSPYAGITFDFTDNILGYVSYSDIFQNQDNTDIIGNYLDPMKGVNVEAGIKAEWLDQRLMTTLSVFSAEQEGLATDAGLNDEGTTYYVPKDVESKGFEIEVVGRIGEHSNVAVGLTDLELTGPDGKDTYDEWVPRTTFNARFDTRLDSLPKLRLGIHGRWQSDVKGTYAKQDAYFLANAFASYELTDNASLRLNINNLFDEDYIGGLAYGAIYGAPINGMLTFEYKL